MSKILLVVGARPNFMPRRRRPLPSTTAAALRTGDRTEPFRRARKTVLLASHALAQVRDNCRRAIWIHEGRLVRDGDAGEVTDAYHPWSVEGGSVSAAAASSKA